jgi:hypothetical protein
MNPIKPVINCLRLLHVSSASAVPESSDSTSNRSKDESGALDKEQAERCLSWVPHPLPSRRQRILSLPSSLPGSTMSANCQSQRTAEQSQSALLSLLPLEIRRLIYQKVLGGDFLHLMEIGGYPHGKLTYRKCLVPFAAQVELHKFCRRKVAGNPALSTGTSDGGGRISFLRTCRQM